MHVQARTGNDCLRFAVSFVVNGNRNRVERFFVVYQIYQLLVTFLVASFVASPSRGSIRTPTWLDKIAKHRLRIVHTSLRVGLLESQVNYDNGMWVR